jgi:hypothetical protein
MTTGTISIIVGVVLLVLLKTLVKDDKSDNYEENHLGEVDSSDDPGLAHLPGNSYHYIWTTKNSNTDEDYRG